MHKPYLRLLAGKLPILMHRRLWPTLEFCGSSGPPIPKVPCLHQIDVYIKRKLRVWGTQKCNLLVGAQTIPTVTCRQTIYLFSCTAVYGQHWKFAVVRGLQSPSYCVFTKSMFISKGSYGCGEPKNVIS